MSISLNMIVGGFEEPFLEAALTSVEGLIDEVVIVDTSPDDQPNSEVMTRLWRGSDFPVKIINMPRGEGKDFSFSAARDLALRNSSCDWILKWDADEVMHEKDIEVLRAVTKLPSVAGVELAFYHFMVYPWLYQFIDVKTFLFLKNRARWSRGVHESLSISGNIYKLHEIKVYHYGYCRGQAEVFKRWQLYAEIEGKPDWYHGVNPDTIIEDRISVCQNFTGNHPKVIQPTLEKMFSDCRPFRVKEVPRYSMTDSYTGFSLITYNDDILLDGCLETLINTVTHPTILHCTDLGSTDGSLEKLKAFRDNVGLVNSFIKSVVIEEVDLLEPLTITLNRAFEYLLSRQECEYIGWIHPDMRFNRDWLDYLLESLENNANFGKVCSFNSRDGIPSFPGRYVGGQEQCYLVKRGVLLNVGLFDTNFIGIGGYEDWDINSRIKLEGLEVLIDTKSIVWHKGMSTRERRDTTEEQVHNREVYVNKWGHGREV